MKLVETARRHPWRTFALLWLVSVVVVVAFIPSRLHGTRNAYDAFVPLRPATADELADLLDDARLGEWKHTGVVAIDDDTVTVHTRRYLLDEPEVGSRECSWRRDDRAAEGKRGLCAATWTDHVIRHRVAQDALEASLGRALHNQDFDTELAVRPVSHDPRWVPLYVVVESLVFALLMAMPLLAVARLGWSTLLPVLFLECPVLLFGVQAYSPAFLHADNFHQRIVIEHFFWFAVLGIVPLGATLPISLPVMVASLLARRRRAREAS